MSNENQRAFLRSDPIEGMMQEDQHGMIPRQFRWSIEELDGKGQRVDRALKERPHIAFKLIHIASLI